MKRTPWTLALILTLATSSALFADRDRYSSNDRCPRPDQMGRVATLSRGIDQIADQLHERAERNNRRPNRYFARVLGDLHDLSNAASHFRAEVESYRRDPRHTRDDFRGLMTAYDAVYLSLRDIDPRSYIDRDMERIGRLLAQLDDYYGYGDRYSSGRYGRPDRSDRYDRNGNLGGDGWRPRRYPASFGMEIEHRSPQ